MRRGPSTRIFDEKQRLAQDGKGRHIRRVSYLRPGRLIPKTAGGLRARTVQLKPGERMARHSTGHREELLIMVDGSLRVEAESPTRTRRLTVTRGEAVFLPKRTPHAIINASQARAIYLYVTGT